MSDLPISNSSSLSPLERLKQQRLLATKPFPVWALLIIYNKSRTVDTYCNYFEGFKLLRDWLSPIELTPHSEPIPKLYRSYEIQELAKHLNTTQENINHGYQTALSIIQLASNITFLPTEIPTEKIGSAGTGS